MLKKFMIVIALCGCKVAPDAKTTTQGSAVQNESTKRAKAPTLEPETDPALDMVIPQSFLSPLVLPPDEPLASPVPDEPSIYSGSINIHDLFTKYSGLVSWYNTNFTTQMMAKYATCKAEFLARGGQLDARVEWTVAVHVVGDGTVARIVEVFSKPEVWPPMLDEEAKQCVLAIFHNYSTTSAEIVDVTIDLPLCFIPPFLKEDPQ